MIKKLVIHNLVLVDSCEICFGPSFHAITGETGAGKTVLTEAIRLSLGERADSELIRKGCDRASIELYLCIQGLTGVRHKLEEAGLEWDEEEIVIRREIAREGKNRAFINCKAVPLPLLQEIGQELIDLIGQQSHQILRSSDTQRRLLDLFGDLEEDLVRFQESYRAEKAAALKVEQLESLCQERDKKESIWRFQWEELEQAPVTEEEELQLFARYEQLSHAQELTEKRAQMTHLLSEGSTALIPQLNTLIRLHDSLLPIDPALKETSPLLQEARVHLQEAFRILESETDQELPSPQLLAHLEERLSLITKLKRKYGPTFHEIEELRRKLQEQLSSLSTLQEDLEHAQEQLALLQQQTELLSQTLSRKRAASAHLLGHRLAKQLHDLNMPGAAVDIRCLPSPRNAAGDDLIQFWLQANPGEMPCPVKEQASGGEVSRLLFAIKMVLAEKNKTPTLIFDEIDANVGGKTATLLGTKLKELGRCKQVICITHFPQVASQADTHFQVQKIEAEGRTLTQIRCLDAAETHQELIRMGGG